MNDTEINQKLHEAMGNCILKLPFKWEKEDGDKLRCLTCGELAKKHPRWNAIPNYTGSLDAVSVAEKWIVDLGKGREYIHRLGDVCGPTTGTTMATAHQRALAVLKTLGVEV